MGLGRKIAFNTVVQFVSKILATLLGLATVAIITRYLGQTGFGEYTTAMTFCAFFGIIADLGLTLVTVQIIAKPGVDEERALGNLLALRLVTAVVFLGLAPLSVWFFPYSASVKLAVAVVTASFLFTALNQIMVGLFQKHLRLDKVSIAEVSGRLALLAGTILAVRLDWGLLGIMAITVLANGLQFGLHYVFSRRFARIRLRFDLAAWKSIVKKSWPLAATIILNLIYLRADTLLLSLIRRPTEIGIIAEVGVYGAAYKVIDVLITFPFVFAGIILPVLTANWVKNNREKFDKTLQKSFDFMAILAIPLMIGTQLVAPDIMRLVAGSEFVVSGPILGILILAAGLIYLGVIHQHAIIAIDRQKNIIGAYIFVAVTAVLAYLYVIPRWSYMGAAWVTIYSELAIAAAAYLLVRKYTGFSPAWGAVGRSLAAALLMAGAGYLLINAAGAGLIVVLSASVLVYFTALYLLGGIKKQEIMELVRPPHN